MNKFLGLVLGLILSVPAFAASTSIVLPTGDSITILSAPGGTTPPPPPPLPPPPVGAIVCPGFAKTLVIPLDWNNANIRMLTYSYGGFEVNDAVVVTFTTGNVSSTNNLPHIDAVEYQGTASWRIAKLSSKPCDFSLQAASGANIAGNTVSAIFAVGTGSGFGFYPVLLRNTTYYLNIKNDLTPGCASTSCNMGIALFKPGGL